MPRFLAEDFRNLMDAIDRIGEEGKTQDTEQSADTKDLLVTDRPSDISKESVKNIYDLIEYLDQFPELSKWRNPDAQYDDAFYDDLPLTELETVAQITAEDIKRIADDTRAYEGDYYMQDGTVSIFGGD